MCCLLWTVAGEVEAAAPGLSLPDVRMPPALFSGPRGYPLVSYNPGPVHSFMVMLYPAAPARLAPAPAHTARAGRRP